MWFLQPTNQRTAQDDLGLGTSTAAVAGFVNVCSVMTFFAFSSNVTGHVATFVEQLVRANWSEVATLFAWMVLFLLGAFVANTLVTRLTRYSVYASQSAPWVLQTTMLCAIAYYGHHHYQDTLWETELLVGALLFTMGLQNGTVVSVSNFVVRTTHLTGLFTDLAVELSMISQRQHRDDTKLRERLRLHGLILAGYVLGGVIGGACCMLMGLRALYLASAVLSVLMLHDLFRLRQRRPAHSYAGTDRRG